jgi:hypothetical protein
MKAMHDENKKIIMEYDQSYMRWKTERGDLHARLTDISRNQEKNRDENIHVKAKTREYKEKIRMANNTLRVLSAKVAQYEMDRQGERDNDYRPGSSDLE